MLACLLDPRSVHSGGGLFFLGDVTQWPMRRAIVISILIHLFILANLLEPPSPPAGGLSRANGGSPLAVGFKSPVGIDKKDAAFRGVPMVVATEQPARPKIAVSPVVAKRRREEVARQEHSDRRSSVRGEPPESLVALPVDLEREYRIDLARAARRSPYYPAALIAKGQHGVVRMGISYWSQSGAPSITLEQSSGYRDLDQEALKTLALAIGTVPLPAEALGINFRMQYALEYRLGD